MWEIGEVENRRKHLKRESKKEELPFVHQFILQTCTNSSPHRAKHPLSKTLGPHKGRALLSFDPVRPSPSSWCFILSPQSLLNPPLQRSLRCNASSADSTPGQPWQAAHKPGHSVPCEASRWRCTHTESSSQLVRFGVTFWDFFSLPGAHDKIKYHFPINLNIKKYKRLTGRPEWKESTNEWGKRTHKLEGELAGVALRPHKIFLISLSLSCFKYRVKA